MIDKSINNIDCVVVREKLHMEGQIHLDPKLRYNSSYLANGTEYSYGNATEVFFDISQLERDVCHAEIDSQKLDTQLNVYTASFG